MPPFAFLTGPLLVGTYFHCLLFGVFLVQLYEYYNTFRNTDKRLIRAVVYFIAVLEVLQAVLIPMSTFQVLVIGFGSSRYLVITPWASAVAPAINGLIAYTVQVFFAWRIMTLKPDKIGRLLAAIVFTIALMQFACSIAVVIQYFLMHKNASRIKALKDTGITWLTGTFACDLTIASCMVYLLAQAKKRTPFPSSASLINSLIVSTVETALVTAIFAFLSLVLYLIYPDNFLHVCMEFILGRLFGNVLLASLNGRARFRNMNTAYDSLDKPDSGGPLAFPSEISTRASGKSVSNGNICRRCKSQGQDGSRDLIVMKSTETRHDASDVDMVLY